MPATQPDLFTSAPDAPDGFRRQADLISAGEERELVRAFETLPFKPFEFHGHLGNRRIVSFGWRYDYAREKAERTEPIPELLLPLRAKVAAFAGRPAEAFEQALINEYRPGAGIGWHRDKPQFDEVVGVSLLSPCVMRLRRRLADGRFERRAVPLEPRSVYLLSAEVRREWEHSIVPHERLRYSVTFRTLRPGRAPALS